MFTVIFSFLAFYSYSIVISLWRIRGFIPTHYLFSLSYFFVVSGSLYRLSLPRVCTGEGAGGSWRDNSICVQLIQFWLNTVKICYTCSKTCNMDVVYEPINYYDNVILIQTRFNLWPFQRRSILITMILIFSSWLKCFGWFDAASLINYNSIFIIASHILHTECKMFNSARCQ